MKRHKYYFAVGNCPLLLAIFLSWIVAFTTGIEGLIFCTILFLPSFYYFLIHTSITFYEDSVKFKIGAFFAEVNYEDILEIVETRWDRPLCRSYGKAHVLDVKDEAPIGIEHYMFSRETTMKIIEHLRKMKKSGEIKVIKEKNSTKDWWV